MIIGMTGERLPVGAITRIDFLDGDELHEDVPVMVLRHATVAEWLAECGSSKQARQNAAKRLWEFHGAHFYDVSVD